MKKNISEVFIPGGLPVDTYVKRRSLGMESIVEDWNSGPHTTILVVSGPTKSGKTVLVRKIFEDAVWFFGGEIDSADEFWEGICEEFDEDVQFSESLTITNSSHSEKSGGVDVGVLSGGISKQSGRLNQSSSSVIRKLSPKRQARKVLIKEKPTVVLDDFHYIPSEEQKKIIRGLKDPVFSGVPVILLAVPHHSHDVVRGEKEMTGRVSNATFSVWDVSDLSKIGEYGFGALDMDVNSSIIKRLARESFGSPHLMQGHCLELANRVSRGNPPENEEEWRDFFVNRVSREARSSFDLLRQGPRQRSDRKVRYLKSGVSTDIYGATLSAIANTGPKSEIQYEEIRSALREVLRDDVPKRNEITNVLEQMSDIALNKIDGEPVIEYDKEYSRVYVVDPFFLYFMRWSDEMEDSIDLS